MCKKNLAGYEIGTPNKVENLNAMWCKFFFRVAGSKTQTQ
jgi:hypothetical protein